MEKVMLSLEDLVIESLAVLAEKERGTVNANELAPTRPHRAVPVHRAHIARHVWVSGG